MGVKMQSVAIHTLTLSILLSFISAPAFAKNNSIHHYSLFYKETAPESVKEAALELRTYVKKTLGKTLPILHTINTESKRIISLGLNGYCRKNGFGPAGIKPDGYRIVTKNGRLFIFGIDTPDQQKTLQGGVSNGTRNGVYAFIENFLGVRWLIPGELGEYIPSIKDFSIENIDVIEGPVFSNRRIAHIQNDNPLVKKWLKRQRQGFTLELNHSHNFTKLIPTYWYDQHPEWFPEINFKRVRPAGNYKLETTNDDLIRQFSKQVAANIKANNLFSESISPSDGGGWSQSTESKLLWRTDAFGRRSLTRLVLKFYNDVAEKIALDLPNKYVCGYVYADYLDPDAAVELKVAPNLFLIVAPHISYGYGLYRPATRKRYEDILTKWAADTTHIAYYDLPNTFEQTAGALNPPATELLGYIYPKLADLGYKGVYLYGTAWGQGALTNYLIAKLNWNPYQNPEVIQKDFLAKAYGVESASNLHKMYDLIDKRNKQFHQSDEKANHKLSKNAIKSVYLPILPEIESFFAAAETDLKDNGRKKRFEILKYSMERFYQYLTSTNLIATTNGTYFSLSDDVMNKKICDQDQYLKMAVGFKMDKKKTQKDGALSVEIPQNKNHQKSVVPKYYLRGPVRYLLYKDKDDAGFNVDVKYLKVYDSPASMVLSAEDGTILKKRILTGNDTFQYRLESKTVYFLDFISKNAIYEIEVNGCRFALCSMFKGEPLHFISKLPPLYFYLDKYQELMLTFSSDPSIREAVAADLYSPDAKLYGDVDDSITNMPVSLNIQGNRQISGFWKIDWKMPAIGSIEDVYFSTTPKISWLNPDPDPQKTIIVR